VEFCLAYGEFHGLVGLARCADSLWEWSARMVRAHARYP
jgi:hypothetical protein